MRAFSIQLKRAVWSCTAFVWCLALLYLISCQANVDLISEKRIIDKIEGTPRCEQSLRKVEGNNGQVTMRLYLIDDSNEEIPPNRLVSTTTAFGIDNLSVRNGRTLVLDAETGRIASNVSVNLTLQAGSTDTDWIRENPNYTAVKQTAENLRASRAVAFLLDMSEGVASVDASRTRAAAAAGWISLFNQNLVRGSLDIFALLLMRNDRFTQQDNLFINASDDRQFIGASGRERGFVLTTATEKNDFISQELIRITNTQINRNAPIFGTVKEAALLTRDVSWGEDGTPLNNPALIGIIGSLDAHTLKPQDAVDQFGEARAEIKRNDLFIPPMFVTYPRSVDVKTEDWERQLDQLCDLARTANVEGGSIYFGQVFPIRPNLQLAEDGTQIRDTQDSVRNQLDMAFHAMSGWVEIRVSYTLTGAQPGKTYYVAFVVDGEFLGETTNKSQVNPNATDKNKDSYLIFEVKAN